MPNPALPKSSEQIAADIAAAIIERRLPAGTKLKEEALARLYDVSRTKIRAALLMLSMDELIDIVPEKGAFVSKPSRREAQEIFAVRRILEAALVREFMARVTPSDYQRIDRHLAQERLALESNNTQLRARLLGDFHILLADIAGNQVLKNMIGKLTARTSLVAMHYQSRQDAEHSSDEHATFVEAARSGNVERATEMMLLHLDHVLDALRFDDEEGKDLVKALLA
jgi:DNA-binding GntR family transcriptional regulator